MNDYDPPTNFDEPEQLLYENNEHIIWMVDEAARRVPLRAVRVYILEDSRHKEIDWQYLESRGERERVTEIQILRMSIDIFLYQDVTEHQLTKGSRYDPELVRCTVDKVQPEQMQSNEEKIE